MNILNFSGYFQGSSVRAKELYIAQAIAKKCLNALNSYLRPGLSQAAIHSFCRDYMTQLGSEGWWTHDDPALILFGPLTTYSAHLGPGERYENLFVQENDVITVDVAPTVGGGWGDMARTYIMENGVIIPWEQSSNPEIVQGMALEQKLHQSVVDFVCETTTFAQLHAFVQSILDEHDYYNCDYHGNFGHTIENHPNDRVTIVPEENRIISEYNKPITFEPHICKHGGSLGFKYENMYVFLNGHLELIDDEL